MNEFDNEDIKIGQGTATVITPGNGSAESVTAESLNKTMEETAKVMQEKLDSLSDEVPPSNGATQNSKAVKNAKNFLDGFMNFIKGDKFTESINRNAIKYNIPPKRLAQGFFGKILGTIGDVLGIAIGTVRSVGHTVINVIGIILNGAVDLVCNVANAIASIFTLNSTNVVAA